MTFRRVVLTVCSAQQKQQLDVRYELLSDRLHSAAMFCLQPRLLQLAVYCYVISTQRAAASGH